MKLRVKKAGIWIWPGAPITITLNVGQIWNAKMVGETSIEIRRQNVELTMSRFAVEDCFEEVDEK